MAATFFRFVKEMGAVWLDARRPNWSPIDRFHHPDIRSATKPPDYTGRVPYGISSSSHMEQGARMADGEFRWEVNVVRLDVKGSGKAKLYGDIGELRVFEDRLMWRKHKSAFGNPPWKNSLPFSSITKVHATRKDLLNGRLWISHTGGELCFHMPGGNNRAQEIAEFIATAQGLAVEPTVDEP